MTFDLLTEPWIPVILRDGATAELSLRQCFERSADIRKLSGDLPTQSFAILRVMLAICHDAIGFHSEDDISQLLRKGIDLSAIRDYLDKHPDRFDLFHSTRPFFQVPTLRTAKGEVAGLEKLISDVPNGIQFLTVRARAGLERISSAEAARWLIHSQAFDPSGIRSAAVGDAETKGGKGYPIGPAWCGQLGGVVLHGNSLAETLAFNLAPTPPNPLDRPVWALDHLQTEQRQIDPQPQGPVSLLVWQSRRIRLAGDRYGVTGVVLCQGDRMTPQNRHGIESMTAWRYSKPQSKKLGITVYMPLKHDPNRDLWRGLPALLQAQPPKVDGHDASIRAGTLETLASQWEDAPDLTDRLRLEAVGIDYGPQEATIAELVNDILDLRVSLLGKTAAEVVAMVQDSIETCDTCVWSLGRMAANIAKAAGDFDGVDGAADNAKAMGWSAINGPARSWIATLTASTDVTTARREWQTTLRGVLKDCARRLADSANPAATIGRKTNFGFMTTAKAELIFDRTLHKELPLAYPPREEKDAS